MQSQNILKLLFRSGILGISISSVVILAFILIVPIHSFSVITSAPRTSSIIEQATSGLPVRLIIPKIALDAPIEHLGLTPTGAIAASKVPENAAWFDRSSRPGEKGNSVIDGHYGWLAGVPAAFDSLHKLQKGDLIYVKDNKGTTVTFVVSEFRVFGEYEDTSTVFASDDDKAHLNLITCAGEWNAMVQSYSDRLVVFADRKYE